MLAADYGDAPSGYALVSHEAVGPMLGILRYAGPLTSAERFTELANGDAADEDGVVFGVLRAGQAGTMTVHVENAPAGAKLDAWLDYGRDFDLGTAGDQVVDNTAVVNGDNVFTFNVPAGAVSGYAYARIRLSTAGNLNPETGAAADGEIEDYLVPVAAANSEMFSGQNIVTFTDASTILPVDLDSDGDLDLLTGALAWAENIGGPFAVPTPLPMTSGSAGGTPLAVADLDRDGDWDVVTSGNWLENNGAQRFTNRALFSGISVVSASVVDFDGDGDLDALGGGSSISWYANNGSQSFSSRSFRNPSGGVRTVQAVDFDEDGDLDVLASAPGMDAILLYRSDGTQNFASIPFTSITTTALDVQAAQAVDLDEDGDLDILAATWGANPVSWFENDGAESFTRRVIDAGSWNAQAVVTVDMDADGDLDVAAVGSGGRVAWYENDGEQLFTARPVLASTLSAHLGVAVADLDADGLLDLMTAATGSSPVAWYRQVAQFDYGDAVSPYRGVYLQDNGARHLAVGPTLGALRDAESDGSRAPAAAEAEDDGVVFGAAGHSYGTVTVNVQNAPAGAKLDAWIDFNGDGSWGSEGEQVYAAISVVEGDNLLAFAIPSWAVPGATYARFRLSTAGGQGINGAAVDGEVEDHPLTIEPRGPATGLFSGPQPISTAPNAFIVTADVDGDGDVDVATKSGGGISWQENLGAGGFVTHSVPGSGMTSEDFAAGDLDSDGDVDFVGFGSTQTHGQLIWMENDGQQNFTRRFSQFQFSPLSGTSSGLTALAIADMDSDGDMDVLATKSQTLNGVYLWVNNGQEQFSLRSVGTFPHSITTVVAADLDQDGDMDVVARARDTSNLPSSEVVWLQNNGALTFAKRNVLIRNDVDYYGTTEAVAVGDMDGDGDLDVVAAGYNQVGSHDHPVTLSWHEHVAGDEFVAHDIDFGRGLRWATLADFDGDGDLDILTSGATSSIDLYENVGATQFIRRQIAVGQGTGLSTAAADMDGDGDLDALATGVAGAASVAWFENFNLNEPDYGDAPGPYPTTRADDGPLHNGGGPRLGALRDDEADGAPTPGADGDAGDDGVTFGVVRAGQSTATVTVNVQSAPAGARLDAWIDFNGDGSWGGAGEQIFASTAVVEGDNVLSINVPANAAAGATFARFRLSSTGALRPGGAAVDGEVEDYALSIASPAPATGEYVAAGYFGDYFSAHAQIIRAADIDGDGDPDLLVHSDGGFPQNAWIENLGDGAFLTHSNGLFPTLQVLGMRPVDLDRDGDMDFVATVSTGVAWFENNGDESFNYRPPTASVSQVRAVFDVADVDGDGDLDVIASRQAAPSQITVFFNDGRQRFSSNIAVNTPTAYVSGIRAADVDGDGDMDFAASFELSGSSGAIAWYENVSLGFVEHLLTPTTTTEPPTIGRDVAPVDFDRDGDVDLVTSSYFQNRLAVDWFENVGAESFTRRSIGTDFSVASSAPSPGADRLHAADVDGDGDNDVVVGDYRGYWLFRNDGASGFVKSNLLQLFTTSSTPLAIADFDGDGVLEIAVSSSPYGVLRLNDRPFGDYDRNGFVDDGDYALWQQTLGQIVATPGAGADGDRSGVIDQGDFDVWEANMGRGPAPLVNPADFLQDQRIDGHDFLMWQRRLGTTYPYPGGPPGSADADFSGAVDAGDLEVWKRQFGEGVTLDQAWINAPDTLPSDTAMAQPALAANVLLALAPAPTASLRPAVSARSSYRPAPRAGVARDVALAQWFPPAATDADASSAPIDDLAETADEGQRHADDPWFDWDDFADAAL
jgi:hypothetical protein